MPNVSNINARARVLPALLLVAGLTSCAAPSQSHRTLDELESAPLHALNEAEIDRYLKHLAGKQGNTVRRVVAIARKSIGQPCRLFCLGEFPFELHDPDPLYRLDASDCVTFVEQTYAMALSRDWPSFMQMLQRIRYREGVIGIRTRNHFTEADWNVNNAWRFEDVTARLGGDAVVKYRLEIDRAAFLRKAGVEHDVPVQILEDEYIPRGALDAVSSHLRDGDVIEFVRGPDSAPFVGHMGIIAHNPAGEVTLLHSGRPAVRELPLDDYLSAHPAFIAVKVLRPR